MSEVTPKGVSRQAQRRMIADRIKSARTREANRLVNERSAKLDRMLLDAGVSDKFVAENIGRRRYNRRTVEELIRQYADERRRAEAAKPQSVFADPNALPIHLREDGLPFSDGGAGEGKPLVTHDPPAEREPYELLG